MEIKNEYTGNNVYKNKMGDYSMKKIMKQIYARMWLAWRLLRLHFVRIPESEDGKSQEQLLEEIRKRSGLT